MDFLRIIKNGSRLGRDTQGIALFMVLAAVSVLAILVTDFVYITQVGQAIAYGGLDQAQAHYLAKSGLKISLLRLKFYKKARDLISKASAAGASPVPKSTIEKIWNYPFFFPIPTDVPGMTPSDRDLIVKFQKDAAIDGKFSAIIESESSKYNLNSIVPGFGPSPSPAPSSSASPTTDPAALRDNLTATLTSILNQKIESDPDFSTSYRDFRVPDLVDQMSAWAYRKYERQSSPNQDPILMKRAPFYSVAELHNLALIDEELYQLFAPHFTASLTSAININTIQEGVLRALVPKMTKDEATEFLKFRDSDVADNNFKKEDDFFTYLTKQVAAYENNPKALDDLKSDFAKRNIILITEETFFKITVQATVNSATRTLQAWVTLGEPGAPLAGDSPDSGITITSMKMD